MILVTYSISLVSQRHINITEHQLQMHSKITLYY